MKLNLTDKKLKKFRERCLLEAKRKFGMSEEDAEEFAQEYLLMLTTKGWMQSVGQACIDFARKRFGRTGKYGSSNRKVIPLTFTDLDATWGQNSIERIVRVDPDNSRGLSDFEAFIKNIVGTDRVILVLKYEWGFNNVDLGRVLGVSESRISQLHNTALSAQKERIKKETARENERERQREVQTTLSPEVQNRSALQAESKKKMEIILSKDWEGGGFFKVKEISETLQGSFRINAF